MPLPPGGHLRQVPQKRVKANQSEKANQEGTDPFHSLSSIHYY